MAFRSAWLLLLSAAAAAQAATLSSKSTSSASKCSATTFPKATSTTITRTLSGIVNATSTTYYTRAVAQTTVTTSNGPGSAPTSYDYSDAVTSTTTQYIYRTSTNASHTTHVTTPCGFTPVLSEPIYRAHKSIVTTRRSSIDVNAYTTIYSTVTGSTSYVPSNLVVVTAQEPSFVTKTVSTTTTVSSPTATIYDACKANNHGSAVGNVPGADGWNLQYFNIPSFDATACCQACQTTQYCAASALDVRDTEGYCFLYVRQGGDNGTAPVCVPSQDGPSVGPNIFNQIPNWIISNGPCGQWVFDSSYN